MILITAAVLTVLVLVGSLVAYRTSCHRHYIADMAAAEQVLLNGETIDAAELIWSVRQATLAPSLEAIASPDLKSAWQMVSLVSETVESLPPDQRLDLLTTRIRLQQTRNAREALSETADSLGATAGPAAADALILALGQAVDLADISGALVTVGVETLAPQRPLVGAIVDHVPGADHALDTVASLAGDQVENVVGAVIGSHIPVITVVMALRRANRSKQNGLDPTRIQENLAWDIGAKGGSIAGGAALGTAILPGIGTIIGGFIGAAIGSGAAHAGKHRHLAEARRQLVASVEELGKLITTENLHQLLLESERMLSMKKQHHQQLVHEANDLAGRLTRRQRVFHPTTGRKMIGRVLDLAKADTAYDEDLHEALQDTISRSSSSTSAKAYLWAAGSHLMGWQSYDGPDTSRLRASVKGVETEQDNVTMSR